MAHSRNVGRAAELIAERAGLDKDLAYTLGLLHDVGRYEGVGDLRHVIAGCNLASERGFEAVARICLTHSFPTKKLEAYAGQLDCPERELGFIKDKLARIHYDDYDLLIQLCDSIALPQGICLLETRLMDVVRRYGFREYTLKNWDAYCAIKDRFDRLVGGSIYDCFRDEVISTSIR